MATDIPRPIKLEAEALRRDGCNGVHIGIFDREAGVWVITFTRGSDSVSESNPQKKALLMWAVEVDV